jgi:DNA mismatch repair ATPase MutS
MKALLMYPDRDFDFQQTLPWNEQNLTQDLDLLTLLNAMAGGDEFVLEVVRKVLLLSVPTVEVVLHRQAILRDCLRNSSLIRDLYKIATDAVEAEKRDWWRTSSHYASSMLYGSNKLLTVLVDVLRKLRNIAEQHGAEVSSTGFGKLFTMFREEFNEPYLGEIEKHLAVLRFEGGVLISSALGGINEGVDYALRQSRDPKKRWFERLLNKPSGYTLLVDPRDETGGRIVSEMRAKGICRVAIVLAEAADHVANFFAMLKSELAFYVGCLNLYDALTTKGLPICFPTVAQAGQRRLSSTGLYDVCLALRLDSGLVPNSTNADGKDLVVITGANQGGKTTFLRSIGVAQLMMQCGAFVGAEAFRAELCSALVTHFKREEDATMQSGKLDEELSRMSDIINHIGPNSLLLLNESFAATNDREGSEIARQIVNALLEGRAKICYVTHLHQFAQELFDKQIQDVLFLRPQRDDDGRRTFVIREGRPLHTSFGSDLYESVFGTDIFHRA